MTRNLVQVPGALGLGRLMFEGAASQGKQHWCWTLDRPFRPEGLWVWGVNKHTKIESVTIDDVRLQRVGNGYDAKAAAFRCPGILNEEFARMLQRYRGDCPFILDGPPGAERNVFWDHVLRGERLKVTTVGSIDAGLIWGTTWVIREPGKGGK